MANDLYNISIYFQWVGSLFIAIGCLHHYAARPRYLIILGFGATISFLISLAQKLSALYFSAFGINLLANSFTLVEVVVYGLYFVTVVSLYRKFVFSLITFYLVFYAAVVIYFENQHLSFIRLGRDFTIIMLALSYFYYLLKRLPESNLISYPPFWINAATLFFFSGTFILSVLIDYIVEVHQGDFAYFWAFRNFFRFAFCLVLTYAAWLEWKSNPNRPSNTTSSSSASLS